MLASTGLVESTSIVDNVLFRTNTEACDFDGQKCKAEHRECSPGCGSANVNLQVSEDQRSAEVLLETVVSNGCYDHLSLYKEHCSVIIQRALFILSLYKEHCFGAMNHIEHANFEDASSFFMNFIQLLWYALGVVQDILSVLFFLHSLVLCVARISVGIQ